MDIEIDFIITFIAFLVGCYVFLSKTLFGSSKKEPTNNSKKKSTNNSKQDKIDAESLIYSKEPTKTSVSGLLDNIFGAPVDKSSNTKTPKFVREPKSNQSVDISNTDRNNSGTSYSNSGTSYSNSGRSNSSYSSPSSYGFPDPTKGISKLFDKYGNKLSNNLSNDNKNIPNKPEGKTIKKSNIKASTESNLVKELLRSQINFKKVNILINSFAAAETAAAASIESNLVKEFLRSQINFKKVNSLINSLSQNQLAIRIRKLYNELEGDEQTTLREIIIAIVFKEGGINDINELIKKNEQFKIEKEEIKKFPFLTNEQINELINYLKNFKRLYKKRNNYKFYKIYELEKKRNYNEYFRKISKYFSNKFLSALDNTQYINKIMKKIENSEYLKKKFDLNSDAEISNTESYELHIFTDLFLKNIFYLNYTKR